MLQPLTNLSAAYLSSFLFQLFFACRQSFTTAVLAVLAAQWLLLMVLMLMMMVVVMWVLVRVVLVVAVGGASVEIAIRLARQQLLQVRQLVIGARRLRSFVQRVDHFDG